MTTISDAAWDGSASRWPDAASYAEACLINLNTGPRADWTKDLCKLPVREPSGAINRNAVHAAAAALAGGRGGVQASAEAKKAAARKLKRLYADLKEAVPPSIARMAL